MTVKRDEEGRIVQVPNDDAWTEEACKELRKHNIIMHHGVLAIGQSGDQFTIYEEYAGTLWPKLTISEHYFHDFMSILNDYKETLLNDPKSRKRK